MRFAAVKLVDNEYERLLLLTFGGRREQARKFS
ncbi:hypothetical protein KL86PLE_90519 [uncultured Pleomorphomonas sp.]|uniref:Uncharacterized protein n=1 Tax=uncultured Pleomorphomonas sp. TaxID=442121 RepID=A0A212LPR3_9HYPH|nr:hypothetical protein KL86PLE_90519 [uncultured Pleomorphomonas sp.]